jgi:hypothetical protein
MIGEPEETYTSSSIWNLLRIGWFCYTWPEVSCKLEAPGGLTEREVTRGSHRTGAYGTAMPVECGASVGLWPLLWPADVCVWNGENDGHYRYGFAGQLSAHGFLRLWQETQKEETKKG